MTEQSYNGYNEVARKLSVSPVGPPDPQSASDWLAAQPKPLLSTLAERAGVVIDGIRNAGTGGKAPPPAKP